MTSSAATCVVQLTRRHPRQRALEMRQVARVQVQAIQLKLLELSWVSEYASPAHSSLKPGASGGQYDNRGLPWGIADFGHTASSGGVSSTIRIPFGKSVRVTIQAPPNTFTTSVYWMIVSAVSA